MSSPRTALVTGAGSGIGRQCALALLKDGYQVVLAGRRLEKLDETVAEAKTSRAIPVSADVTDPQSVRELFKATEHAFGRLDVLFNNAGIAMPATSIEDISFEDWNSVVSVNLTGMFLCIQAATVLMKSQDPMGGRIINNGSISAHVPRPKSIAYTATKHAVTGLTRSTALDGREFNIACGQIDIGNADTSMVKTIKQGALQANGETKVEPTMDCSNVSDAVVYMANLPLSANVQFMTVMATSMPYIGRG